MVDKLTPSQICDNLAEAIKQGNLAEAIKWKDKILDASLKVEIMVMEIPQLKTKNKVPSDLSSDDGKKKKKV